MSIGSAADLEYFLKKCTFKCFKNTAVSSKMFGKFYRIIVFYLPDIIYVVQSFYLYNLYKPRCVLCVLPCTPNGNLHVLRLYNHNFSIMIHHVVAHLTMLTSLLTVFFFKIQHVDFLEVRNRDKKFSYIFILAEGSSENVCSKRPRIFWQQAVERHHYDILDVQDSYLLQIGCNPRNMSHILCILERLKNAGILTDCKILDSVPLTTFSTSIFGIILSSSSCHLCLYEEVIIRELIL